MILATVSLDRDFHKDVRSSLDGHLRFEAAWDLSYEDGARLLGVSVEEKCILILDFGDAPRALPIARAMDGRPQIASIAAAKLASADDVLGALFAFMPAKPGCGATTVATYATAIASQMIAEPTLLLDFDIRLGVTSFLLKSEGIVTIVDALLQTDHLDQDLWSSLIAQLGNLHLLVGACGFCAPGVDLPGAMEDFECETLLRSKRIFLVCTPDIGALHVARRKARWLQDLRLTEKVSVVLNCVERRSALSVDDLQRIIQLPIRYILPANTGDIARAVQKGAVLDSSSGLGKDIAQMAAEMTMGRPTAQKPNAVRRFVEYFSISAARDAR